MDGQALEAKVMERGRAFFEGIRGQAPGIFNKSFWTGKVMDWAMRNEDFKVQLFRFVDVLPYLNTNESLSRHIKEYFTGQGSDDIPAVLKWGAGASGVLGKLGGAVMAKAVKSNIENMARQFIIGENAKEAVAGIAKLRKQGFAFTLDLLGEATVSEQESEAYMRGYLDVLDALGPAQAKWTALGGSGNLDWGQAPMINVSVKPSALYSQAKPVDVQGSAEGILKRLKAICRKVKEVGGAMCVDMEALKYKEMTIELFKRLRLDPEFRDYPHLSLVLQAYLRDTEKDLDELLAWARENNAPMGLRLVKGAYWDYETVLAKQNNWPVPVWTRKPESDAAFERLTRKILENSDLVYYQCASHNIRSISHAMETAVALGVDESRYEFQVLYGMAEPVRQGLKSVAGRVRLYCPYGELIPGMAYLVRRLLENTANESFLRMSFADEADIARLLENPEQTLARETAQAEDRAEADRFRTCPLADFTIPGLRRDFQESLRKAESKAGAVLPLAIGGKRVQTPDKLPSLDPAEPSRVVAEVCQAGPAELDQAVGAAKRAFASWRRVPAEKRAEVLFKAAALARERLTDLSAIQVLEVGKQWDQAYHDVTEAVDFLEYYAREALRLAKPERLGREPGELNLLMYEPRGVTAVIAPWNFPLAISCGMASAAIATGNTVVYKPSGLSSAVGFGLVDLFEKAGLPAGVFNFCPGPGSKIGDKLVDHPDVATIAFTGSVEVGTRIIERAAKTGPDSRFVKRVICEMGGKNAIIIDDDADLDEAVLHVIYAAFAFQGQKCSACSRVIVLEPIYDRFIARLKQAAESFPIGPPTDPANFMGPVVDASQQQKINEYIALAEQEGKVLVKRQVPSTGCYVPAVVVEGITPEHRIAQEEIFGPVLAVMRAKDFDQALAWANSTRFALTGAVFSRSPERLEQARQEFMVGNLYLNRNNTGALVGRQAFGGFAMSGVGAKSGGPNYLHQFLNERLVTENTVRRGFAPVRQDDDWV